MPNDNHIIHRAQRSLNDEFYTTLKSVELELSNYHEFLKDRTVLCNCNDTYNSAFTKYFMRNFHALGIKRLVALAYEQTPFIRDGKFVMNDKGELIYDENMEKLGSMIIYPGSGKKPAVDRLPNTDDCDFINLKGKGSFGYIVRGNAVIPNSESIEILNNCDLVVTNPPFSTFRHILELLLLYNKKFILIAGDNVRVHRDVFPLIQKNELFIGFTRITEFVTPQGVVHMGNVGWYTNFPIGIKRPFLPLVKVYKGHEQDYLKYDNYDAIEVSKTADIPMDYDGVMGVPVSFLDKYNSEQFEIVGSNKGKDQDPDGVYGRSTFLKGKETFNRLFIKRR